MTQLERANKILGTCYNNWEELSQYENLTEEFIREFKDKVNWYCISQYQKLSESFIREFQDKVNWYCISQCQKLSESFIREFKDNVSWVWISKFQQLSESFIREFKDSVSWICISQYQNISDNFIEEFKDKIKKTYLKRNKYIKNRNKAMTKKDLKLGHIVELRNGERYLIVTDGKILFIVDETNWNDLSHYTEDLINNLGHSDLDIIKIYEFTGAGSIDVILWSNSRHKLIWERKR